MPTCSRQTLVKTMLQSLLRTKSFMGLFLFDIFCARNMKKMNFVVKKIPLNPYGFEGYLGFILIAFMIVNDIRGKLINK